MWFVSFVLVRAANTRIWDGWRLWEGRKRQIEAVHATPILSLALCVPQAPSFCFIFLPMAI
jgi:hypothetical protein